MIIRTLTVLIVLFGLSAAALAQPFKSVKTYESAVSGKVSVLACSPTEPVAAIGTDSGHIYLFDYISGERIALFRGHTAAVNDIAFTDDGRYLASAADDGRVQVRFVLSQQLMYEYTNPFRDAYSYARGNEAKFVEFSPDGEYLYYGGWNMMVCRVRYRRGGKPLVVYRGNYGGISSIIIPEDGRELLINEHNRLTALPLKNGAQPFYLDTFDRRALTLTKRPNHSEFYLWQGTEFHRHGYKYERPKEVYSLDDPLTFNRARFDRTGELFLDRLWRANASGVVLESSGYGQEARLREAETGKVLQSFRHDAMVYGYDFAFDGNYVVTADARGTVKVWSKDMRPEEDNTVIETDSAGIPRKINGRLVDEQNTIYVSSPEISFEVWDSGDIDGDIVSLNINGEWVLFQYELKREKRRVDVTLKEEGSNYLILFAVNEGRQRPNTCAVSLTENGRKRDILLNSNLSSCGALNIVYRPE